MQASDIRIAVFSGNYNYVRDGANQALNLLVGQLIAAGASARVYSPTTETPAFAPTGELVSVPAFVMPGGRSEYRLAKGLPRHLRDDLDRFRPNLVHVSAPDILGHRAVTYARSRGIATVASLHTRFETYLPYYNIEFLDPLILFILKRFYGRVDEILVPGPMLADILREWGVATPIAIWSRGVEHARFNPARRSLEWRQAHGIGDDEVVIGFLGRLVLEKGLDVFAEVIAELRRRGVPHRVLVIGEGPAREWFADQVPDAVFTGFQGGDDLARAVAAMDLFFNPSVTETFGNVTLEAMACGVPVVAARATGAVGLVDEGVTGHLVEPRDITGYADAIAGLIGDPERRRAAGAAGHVKAQGYEWGRINQAVIDTYLQVLERKGGR